VQSSKLLDRLRSSGVPDVRSVWKFEAGCASFFTVISIKQRYAGHVQQVAHLAAMVPESAAMGRYFVVVDEDVNPMDIEEVIWVMSTRTDPATSIQFIEGAATNPLDPMLASHDEAWVGSRAVIDACRPFDRRDSFAAVVGVEPGLAERVRERFAQTLGWSR
jgi:UbiD family decarboxylase